MIDRSYKETYRQIFNELRSRAVSGDYDSCGIPSYTHPNPLMAWLFWRRISTALSLAGDITGKSVLDFGCGAGVTFRYLKAKDCQVVACENEFREVARRVAQATNLDASVCSDLDSLAGHRFQVIFALDVLEHVDDLAGIVGRLFTLGEKGTRMIVSGPTENLMYRFGRMLAGFSGHYHHCNIYDVERETNQAGFQLQRVRTLYHPIPLFRVSLWRMP